MDRLDRGGGWLMTLGWQTFAQSGEAEEFVVGSVWGPGVVETVEWRTESRQIGVSAWAVPGRLPPRTNVGLAGVVNAVGLLAQDVRSLVPGLGAGLGTLVVAHVLVPVHVLVWWGAWSILVRVENGGAFDFGISGRFVVRVLDGEQVAPVAFGERVMAPHVARSLSRGVS